MDDLAWLRLQLEWGADEALADQPDRPPAGTGRHPSRHASAAAADRIPAGGQGAQALADAADTIAALQAALAAFEGCALRATATTLVFADGDANSRLVLVADVPGAAEDRAGRAVRWPGRAVPGPDVRVGRARPGALALHQPAAMAPPRRPQADRPRNPALPAVPVAPPAADPARTGRADGGARRAHAAAPRRPAGSRRVARPDRSRACPARSRRWHCRRPPTSRARPWRSATPGRTCCASAGCWMHKRVITLSLPER